MKACLIFTLVLYSNWVSVISQTCHNPTVKTSYGWVRGCTSETRGGRKIFEFLGIKYGREPTGTLRFKEPVPPKPWKGVKLATEQCSACIQEFVVTESSRSKVTGSEDCLCLNVYTPQLSAAKLPVIFFIHGGAYEGFSSDKINYGPELLLDKDVVLVTLNYRLGVLGFLSTEDSVIPGNLGMKDQVLALRWVKDNIAKFGGDPDSITIMGQSSGGSSVHLHMVSPLSWGLFHRAVAHSASALNPWALAKPGVLRSRASQLASLLGCPFTSSSAFLSCLQGLPAEKIVSTTKDYLIWDLDPITIWCPRVESSTDKGAFLVENSLKMTSTMPLLTGFNFAEGAPKTLSMISSNVTKKFEEWNSQFVELTSFSLGVKPDTVDKLRKFYFGEVDEITPEMTTQITQLYGDYWFTHGVLDAVERHKGTKFLYYFNFNTSDYFSVLHTLFNNPKILGMGHFDDLPYVFPMDGAYKNVDEILSSKIVEMWTNFATHSNPSGAGIKWEPVTSTALEYLEISNNHLGMNSNPLEKRRQFYKSLRPYMDS